MKTLTIAFTSILLLSSPFSLYADGNDIYKRTLTKHRSRMGFTNSGTAIYNYQVIDEYDDHLTSEEKGNFELEGEFENVREIYNHIEVNNEIKGGTEKVTLGTIKVNSGRRVNIIENTVSIKGGISGKAKDVSVGAIRIKNSRVRKIDSNVTVEGGVDD